MTRDPRYTGPPATLDDVEPMGNAVPAEVAVRWGIAAIRIAAPNWVTWSEKNAPTSAGTLDEAVAVLDQLRGESQKGQRRNRTKKILNEVRRAVKIAEDDFSPQGNAAVFAADAFIHLATIYLPDEEVGDCLASCVAAACQSVAAAVGWNPDDDMDDVVGKKIESEFLSDWWRECETAG